MALLLLVVFLISNWLWDVAHVVTYFESGYLTNGLWVIDALLTYHLAWYLAIICFFVLFLLYVFELEKGGDFKG